MGFHYLTLTLAPSHFSIILLKLRVVSHARPTLSRSIEINDNDEFGPLISVGVLRVSPT